MDIELEYAIDRFTAVERAEDSLERRQRELEAALARVSTESLPEYVRRTEPLSNS